MSFDLAVWDCPGKPPVAKVQKKYERFCDSKDVPEDGTGKIALFFEELEGVYPSINDYPEDQLDECPWTCPFDRSSDFGVVCMSWSMADDVAPLVMDMAKKHGLLCYDPQEEQVFHP